jgi:ABC-type multidrug transport system fused ATPase/permease subunit
VFDWLRSESRKAEFAPLQLVRDKPASSFYGQGAREVSRRPLSSTAFAAFSCLQSAGHAGLALAGAACAQAMLGVSPRIPAVGRFFSSGDLVVRLAALGFVAACAKAVGALFAAYFQARLSGAFGDAVRLEVLARRARSVAQPRHDDQGDASGDGGASATFAAVDDLTTGVREAQAGFGATLGAARAVLQLVPLALLAMWSSTRLLAVAAFVLLPFGLLLSRAKRRVKAAQSKTLDGSATLLEAADEAIRHAELWSSYGATARVRDRVARAGEALSRRASRAAAAAAGLSGATEALGALALLLALLASRAGMLGAGSESGARLLAFAVAFFMAYKPVRELAEARIAWARAGTAMERLVRNAGPDAPAVSDAASAPAPGALELRGVKLARGKLRAIDARVEAGTIVVLRGPTGVGKTTLLRTLLGFVRPRAGEIRFDGAALERARPFAWVPQDAPIVRGTLADNVALGGAGDEGVRAAMETIGAGELFERLGDAQLGVGGRAVSGGEARQIAIARALATNKPVLLLDEPTTGLDADARAAVLGAIERLRGKRTVLLVTHGSEPLAVADDVIDLTGPSAERDADQAAQ